MTKSEAGWLALRITGVVLALSAIQHLSAILYFGYFFFSGAFADVQGSFSDRVALQTSLPQFFYAIVVLGAAYYLIFRGAALHRLVMREEK